MANTAGICYSFKVEILGGGHNINLGQNTLKMAMYLATGSVGPGTATYSATNEVAVTGDYPAGGKTVTNANVAKVDPVAYWTPSANLSYTGITPGGAFDCAYLYNSSAGGKGIASFTFGATTITGGNFTLTMPVNDQNTGLIRLN